MATLVLDPTNVQAYLGVPTGLSRHKFAIDFLTGDLYYTDDVTGAWTLIATGGSGQVDAVVAGDGITVDATDPANPIVSAGISGSASLNFAEIQDGLMDELTFALVGAVAGMSVNPAWPSALTAGLLGMMFVSAADTITVRLLNMSGAPINLGALTFGATVQTI